MNALPPQINLSQDYKGGVTQQMIDYMKALDMDASFSYIGPLITPAPPYSIFINNDHANSSTSFPIFSVQDAPNLGHNGGRTAIQGYMSIVGSPLSVNIDGYIGVLALCRVASNLTGAAGVYTNYKGNVFAGNSNIFAAPSATYISTYTAHEFDVSLPAGASCAEKHAITIVLTSPDRTRADYDDSALQFNAQDNASAVGWKTGIMFGGYGHQWPFAADSTLIGTQIRQVGAFSPSIALNGIDFSNITFGGYAFLSTSGKVGMKLPVSSAGLVSGDLWNNNGVVNVVP
jgi:hypothetical protein